MRRRSKRERKKIFGREKERVSKNRAYHGGKTSLFADFAAAAARFTAGHRSL